MHNPLQDSITPNSRTTGIALLVLLALSMLATRYHHFSSALHLADTSWAVFFLAGLWFRRAAVLGGLLALAVLIDLGSVVIDGAAMASCFSPAYPGVLLAYAALWGSGRLAGRALDRGAVTSRLGGGLLVAASLLVGIVLAFAISNGTFYALSGQFGEMTAGEYADRTMGYLAGYLSSAVTYSLAGLGGLAAFNLIRESRREQRQA
ncbi:hypothetical protein [Guyparkeria sp.]|uniref:hypothetical protein n=1 Tax=Guyparkeria sp. TaxID=2035736 RepID=UPI00356AF811